MYNRKSKGPRMEPRNGAWGTPALTWYSCEDFPSRTTWSCLLPRKEEIRPNTWHEILQDLSLGRRLACQTLSKALDISSATAWVAVVGKLGHTPTPPFLDQPPFSKIPPFLEIQDVPIVHRFIGKTKVLNNSCTQFVYNFYP